SARPAPAGLFQRASPDRSRPPAHSTEGCGYGGAAPPRSQAYGSALGRALGGCAPPVPPLALGEPPFAAKAPAARAAAGEEQAGPAAPVAPVAQPARGTAPRDHRPGQRIRAASPLSCEASSRSCDKTPLEHLDAEQRDIGDGERPRPAAEIGKL